jgi:hypothetical protein
MRKEKERDGKETGGSEREREREKLARDESEEDV